MKVILLLTFFFLSQKTISQTPIDIYAITDKEKKSITINKKVKISLNPDKTYLIKIFNVNEAHTSLKIKAVSKEIYSSQPELLKAVLPNIPGSISNDQSKFKGTPERNLLELAKEKIKRLNLIKKKADDLHFATLFNSDKVTAQNYFEDIKKEYEVSNKEALANAIKADIQFLFAFKEINENSLKLKPLLEAAAVESYASLLQISEELKKNDYLLCFDYIVRSIGANDYVESKSFTGNKDLVELTIILVDNYAKDTLAKETLTLYTKGGNTIGLSFSTGFFYTEMFSDQSYYLKDRPDEAKALLPDRRTISDISIGGMGHIFYKISPFLRLGPSIGISVSPFDGKSRYLLGGSLLLGKEKMFGLTVGSAWAKVKELSAAVSTDEQGQFLPKGTTTVPTIDRIRSKMFVGITYNLASTRK